MNQEDIDEYSKRLRNSVEQHNARARGQYYTSAHAAGTVDMLVRWAQTGYKKVRINPARLGLSFNTMNVKLNQTLSFIKDNCETMAPAVVEAAHRCRISRVPTEGVFYLIDKGPIQIVDNIGDALELVDEEGAAAVRRDIQAWLGDVREEGDMFDRDVSLSPEDIEWINNAIEPLDDEFICGVTPDHVRIVKHRREPAAE